VVRHTRHRASSGLHSDYHRLHSYSVRVHVLVTGTTEMILSSVASLEPPPIVTTTLEATATRIATQG
jgi:hypothetical protein